MSDRNHDPWLCPFCAPSGDRVFYKDDLVIGLWDAFPVAPGHALIVTTRHVATWFGATTEERTAIIAAIDAAKSFIESQYRPDGYNIGINSGAAAGQTVFHLHVHLIPRTTGDVSDPRGGVRHVIPGRGNYLSSVRDTGEPIDRGTSVLIAGGDEDPLLPHLKVELARAVAIDIAVAFTLRSGVDALWAHFQDFLTRGGRIRFLTGDYLDSTDPDALLRILDLEGNDSNAIQRRVYQTGSKDDKHSNIARSFHPKAYLFTYADGGSCGYIGSSNLSRSALETGVEWNYRVLSSNSSIGLSDVQQAYNRLFRDAATAELGPEWIDTYRARRAKATRGVVTQSPPEELAEPPPTAPEPHSIQTEALAALSAARHDGARAGLVVLATGLGKTWLSAFDSLPFERVLFVAHREEILSQAMQTYRRIRPAEYLGHYNGTDKHPSAAVLFASIQTLSKQSHLECFETNHFDYIVIDEFHHAAASTYRRLIRHFEPQFLLGLTATPERSDGADLLAICDGKLVYQCDLAEGIRRDLLCPFRYFGVPDEVDYRNIPWRSTRFDEEALTLAVATQSRARNALEQLQRRGGSRTLAFCVSQRHADFMSSFFAQNGKRSVSVHSGPSSAPRIESLERLASGDLDVVCAVDMFNEGVDVPDLDTVLMLRPTESKIIWLQQFGRGLRRASPEKRLIVIDYIGNHRTFLLKPRTLFDLPGGDAAIQNLLEQIAAKSVNLPPGCEVTYDLETVNILRGLLRVSATAIESIRGYATDFLELHGVRPSAVEAYRDGYNPRAVAANSGSWFDFLDTSGLLPTEEVDAWKRNADFLKSLEITPMTKSFKMLILLGMINADRFPGDIDVSSLANEVRRLLTRYPRLASDFGAALETDSDLVNCLERNPIAAWVSGSGTNGTRYFEYANRTFGSRLAAQLNGRSQLQELARELAEWRLAEYLDRANHEPGTYKLKVSHSNGRPLVFLDRAENPDLPNGWTDLYANGISYQGNFVQIALNVLRKPGAEDNELQSVLRGWFGPEAGAPGTRHQVRLAKKDGLWQLSPIGRTATGPIKWKAYSREQIPPVFGLEFIAPVWQQGFVRRGNLTFLLVTLDKSDKAVEHQYKDRFRTPSEFQWQSQNRTKADSKDGQSIKNHESLGISIHLFVRKKAKLPTQKAGPFTYCGTVHFESWESEGPITVTWRLDDPLPPLLQREFLQTD